MNWRLCVFLLACACYAQTAPPATIYQGPPPMATVAPAPTLPANWVGVGAGYTAGATPPVNGWASYATLVSGKGQLYSFSSYDIVAGASKPHNITTSARTGFATLLKVWGPVYVLGFGTAGVAASGTATTGAFSGGGIAVLKLGKTAWTLEGGWRVLKTPINGVQNVYEFGTGRTF